MRLLAAVLGVLLVMGCTGALPVAPTLPPPAVSIASYSFRVDTFVMSAVLVAYGKVVGSSQVIDPASFVLTDELGQGWCADPRLSATEQQKFGGTLPATASAAGVAFVVAFPDSFVSHTGLTLAIASGCEHQRPTPKPL